MKEIFIFLVQLLLVGSIFNLIAKAFIPKPIRSLVSSLTYKSIMTLANTTKLLIENVKNDINENEEEIDDSNVVDLVNFKNAKGK